MRRVPSIAIALMSLVVCAWVACPRAQAVTIAFDFNSGVGPEFQSTTDSLWTTTTSGPDVRIFKAADDGSYQPNGQTGRALASVFSLEGDFSVTVDFRLTLFPQPDDPGESNNCFLTILEAQGSPIISQVGRSIKGDGTNTFWGWMPGKTATSASSATDGAFRITRIGSTISQYFAEGQGAFQFLQQSAGTTNPVILGIVGNQSGLTTRSTTAMEVAYDNLVVTADRIVGVPEPVGLGVLAALGACLAVARRRRD